MARVLLIDDLQFIQNLLKKGLAGYGMEVDAFASMKEAEPALDRNRYDAVLLDYFLKDAVGTQLVDDIRKSQGQDVPIMFITANPAKDIVVEMSKLRIAGVIAKSVNIPELVARLEKILGSKEDVPVSE